MDDFKESYKAFKKLNKSLDKFNKTCMEAANGMSKFGESAIKSGDIIRNLTNDTYSVVSKTSMTELTIMGKTRTILFITKGFIKYYLKRFWGWLCG